MAVPSPPPAKPSHLIRNVAIVVILVAVFVGLIAIPVPHSFSDQIFTLAEVQGNATITPPAGAQISGTWSAPDPNTNFQIRFGSALGQDIFSAEGAAGSFSFTASQYEYWFVTGAPSNETVTVSGSYSSPIL